MQKTPPASGKQAVPKNISKDGSPSVLKNIFKDGSTSTTRGKFTQAMAGLINQLEKTQTQPDINSNNRSARTRKVSGQ